MRHKHLLALGLFDRGSRLGDRIEMLLKRGREFSPHVSLARVGTSAAMLLALIFAGTLAPRWIAFAQQSTQFEVASVKPDKTGKPGYTRFDPDGLNIRWGSLVEILATAYQIPYSWISSSDLHTQDILASRYDIVAKAAHEVPKDQILLMLQTLLADRFKLVLHREPKVVPVYKLVVAKGGPKLQPAGRAGSSLAGCDFPKCVAFKDSEMWIFAATLSGRMGRPVLNQTGLEGAYDFGLRLDTLEGLSSDDPDLKLKFMDWSSSSILTDIQNQLGLQLIADKAPVDYLVIDHAEKPDEN